VCALDSETSAKDGVNADFPSLKAAALFHEKKHDSYPASVARKFKLSRSRMTECVDSQHFLAEDQTQPEPACDASKTPESIPACNIFVEYRQTTSPVQSGAVVWKELQRKSSSSDGDATVPQQRKVLIDKELERPIIGISSSHSVKPLTSMSVVLGDFLRPSQLSASADEQPSEFVPMLVCTLCGDRTHSCRDCSRRLGETFCD